MSAVPDPASTAQSGGASDDVAAAFRRIVAVVPVGDLETAKTRLGEALDPEERQDLVLRLLDRTVRAAVDAGSVASVLVVSPDRALLARCADAGADVLRQRVRGLNAALDEARSWATAGEATGVLVLPADLPGVTPEVIDAIVEQGRAAARSGARTAEPRRVSVVVIVPDRRGDGTNALLLVPPDAVPFEFGPGSRQRHAAAAASSGAVLVELDGPLSLDVDLPDDLLLAEAQSGLEVSA